MLSILIPTIEKRERYYNELVSNLMAQIEYCNTYHSSLGKVQIISDNSKPFLEGGLSIGKKREKLLRKVTTKYFCFLDDDDKVAPNYVEVLLRMCNENMDCCTFNALFTNDDYWTIINMNLENINEEARPGIIVKRTLWHVCPIKTDLTIGVDFNDINHNEDWTFIEKILPQVKSQTHTDIILYNYIHSKQSEADKIINETTTN